MASPAASDDIDLDATPPFLLKLFYKTGALHRPEEFSARSLPPHVPIYTYPGCTLTELSHLIAGADPSILPSPAIGTRLVFRLIYPDAQGGRRFGRFAVKELGSVVIGSGKPTTGDEQDGLGNTEEDDGQKTLDESRFVVGDYVSCAILPPLETGAVAPASNAQARGAAGLGEGRTGPMGPGGRGDHAFGYPRGRGGRGGPGGGFGGGRRDGSGGHMPMGEWRRGEELPSAPAGRGRGRGL